VDATAWRDRGVDARQDVSRRSEVALVAGPAVLAGLLCVIQLTGRSLGFDEGASVAIASQHGAALRSAIAHDGGNMAGYYVLLHVLVSAFGNGEWVLRLPSAIGAAAASGLTTAIALRLLDRKTALVAGVLMAVSLPLVFWGQSARSYALLVALCAGSFLAFAALLDSDRPRRAWVLYVACTALAMYASLMAALIVVAQLTALTWRRQRIRQVAAAVVAVVICCIPLAVLAARRGSGQLFWVPRPNLTSVKQVLEALTSAGLEPTFHRTATTYVLLGITIALLLGAVVAVVASRERSGPVLILSWLLVPVGLAFLESRVGQSIFLPRNLLVALPAASLLLAWGLTRTHVPQALALALGVALIALRALQLAPAYGVSPENWRAASAYVLNRTEPQDCVAFYPSDGRNAFRYYVRGTPPRSVLPAAPWSSARAYIEDYASLAAPPTGCPRLWLVSSHEGQADGPARSRANRRRYFALRAMLTSDYAHQAVSEFGYAAPVTVELFSRS
jgi:mannosyltransferase